MTTGSWYTVTFAALSTWASAYGIPPEIAAAANTSSSMQVYIVNDTAGDGSYMYIAYLGGSAVIPAAKMTSAGTISKRTDTLEDGSLWVSIRGVDGSWIYFDEGAGQVRKLTAPGSLSSFIS